MLPPSHPNDLFADHEARVVRELRARQLLDQARLHRQSLATPARNRSDLRRRLGAGLVAIGTWLAPAPRLEPCPEVADAYPD